MKVTIIGAGNVGATCADTLVRREVANKVIMIDLKENFADGKALDMAQANSISLSDVDVIGYTDDYSKTDNSDIIVVTSGLPRKPGMSRDDLIKTNAKIVSSVVKRAIEFSPNSKIIVVSNPLDVMTYVAYLESKFQPNRVFGMAGVLDTARYRHFISKELNCSIKDIQAILMGGHGDTMVPLTRFTTVSGIPVTDLISKDKLDAIVERTKVGGGEIVKLLGTSAWYAPGMAAAQMVEAVIKDQKRILPCCAMLSGHYGIEDMYLGVPVKLGKGGVEEIIELKLNDQEMEMLKKSANEVKNLMEALDGMNLF